MMPLCNVACEATARVASRQHAVSRYFIIGSGRRRFQVWYSARLWVAVFDESTVVNRQ